MKKLAAILCLAGLSTAAFAQGTVSILNGASSLVSYQPGGGSATAIPGPASSFYFALLTAPLVGGAPDSNLADYTFTGVLAHNLANPGAVFGGSGIATAAGTWTPGTDQSFYLAGWSSDCGTTWNPAWLTVPPTTGSYFGRSSFAQGVAGGSSGGVIIPSLNIFGASPSLTQGFTLQPIPEPTTMALAGLGAAALLIFRRRK